MKNNSLIEFKLAYNKKAEAVYFSPGRVNLIGEHLDYNGGLVMPCAISLGTYLLIATNNDNVLRFKSLNFEHTYEVGIQPQYQKINNEWFNYPLGIIDHFLRDGHKLTGLDMLFYGTIPIGSGLSSSASIEVVTAIALNELLDSAYSKLELVKMAKSVENEFIGLNSGIMDQFAVVFGERDKAIMLNCNSYEYGLVHCNLNGHVLAIINTNKPRKLAESKYNERVTECTTALRSMREKLNIENLCEIDPETFYQYKHLITDDTLRNRAQHVVEENHRVKGAATALNDGDLDEFGRLMYVSHQSLRDLYDVSGKELDTIVHYARNSAFVIGAKMTGAGFGGCAIALVKREHFEVFSTELSDFYTKRMGYAPSIYQSVLEDGASSCPSVLEANCSIV